MNLTLHHFLKEFRYLRWRWLAFMMLLAFEMAVNLEWVLPMRVGVPQAAWMAYLPVVVLLAGLSLLLSCPEDRPGSDRSFISTRPMPVRDYWLARVGVWLLLIVLPVVLQNMLYLMLSCRPSADVLRGGWERLACAAGFSAWMLPALVLWRRSEIWKALLTLGLIVFVASSALDVIASRGWRFYPSYSQEWPGLAAGWMLFGLLSAALAFGHLRCGWPFRRRVALASVVAVLSLLTARLWILTKPPITAQNQELVQKLAPGLQVEFDLGTARYTGVEKSFGPSLRGNPMTKTSDPTVHVVLQPKRSTLHQSDRTSHAEEKSKLPGAWSSHDSPQAEVFRGNQVLRDLFPRGTLFFPHDEYFPKWTLGDQSLTPLAVFPKPHPQLDEPLSIQTEYAVEWFQREKAIEIPLVSGAAGHCDEMHWEILRISPEQGPKPGAVTVSLRTEYRGAENGHAILLHLPNEKLVRLDPSKTTITSQRGDKTGWSRSIQELKWEHITHHADGAPTGVDLSSARLILLRSRYLGRSQLAWKFPEIRLRDIPEDWNRDIQWHAADALYRGRELKAFQERMATLTPPTAASTEKEARRYAFDLFSAGSLTRAVYSYAAHPQIAQAFEPLGKHHLPLMLDLRSIYWPGWSNKPPNSLLERYVTEQQRDTLISRAPQSNMLADLVVKKGWAEEARQRLQKQMLDSPVLPSGAVELLLAWKDDPDVIARLLKEARNDFQGDIIYSLDKRPETKAQIERVVKETFDELVPIRDSVRALRELERAAEFGSAEAFEWSLRFLGMVGDTGGQLRDQFFLYPNLLNADGSKYDYSKTPGHERWPLFRRLKVSDFVYVPEKRAWRFLKP